MGSRKTQEYDNSKIEYNHKTTEVAGRGAHGLVIPAFEGSRVIAVKCFSVHGGSRKVQQVEKKMKKEMEVLSLAYHPCVVDVYGWVQWSGGVGIVMEYLVGGNLMEVLEEDIELGMVLKLRFCKEIASGLAYIHAVSEKIRLIHGDMKPENVLLTEKLHCKIGDFGSSKIASYTGSLTLTGVEPTKKQFTFIYAAPELLKNSTMKLLPAHDTYSYSILMHVIICGEMTINRQFLEIYLDGVREREERPSMDKILSFKSEFEAQNQKDNLKILNLMIEIMQECWKQNPAERPRMGLVSDRLHSLFKQFSHEELEKRIATITGGMEFQIPSLISGECRPISQLQLQHAASAIRETPDSSLLSRSTSEPSTSSDPVLAPRRSNSVLTATSESEKTVIGLSVSRAASSFEDTLNSPPQMSAKDYQNFQTKVHAIKTSVKSGKRDEAIRHCEALQSYDVSTIPDASYLFKTIPLLASNVSREVANWEIFCPLIQVVLKMSDHLADSKERFSRVFECTCFVKNFSKRLYKEGYKSVIEEQCLPMLKLCLKMLKETPREDRKEKSRQTAWCQLYTGQICCYIGKYEEAKAASESCLSIMKDAYNRDAKDYSIYAMSYELKADACRALGESETENMYQEAIDKMKSANDINDKNKTGWYDIVTTARKTPHSLERIWEYK